MAVHAFTLEVVCDPRFAVVAPDVASRFLELLGGSPAEASALGQALAAAVGSLGCPFEAVLTVAYEANPAALSVTLRCDGRSTVITHARPPMPG